jgi:hypothetical protein
MPRSNLSYQFLMSWGDFGDSPAIDWVLDCAGTGLMGSSWVKNFTQIDKNNILIRTTISQAGSSASGECELRVTAKDKNDFESNEIIVNVNFNK